MSLALKHTLSIFQIRAHSAALNLLVLMGLLLQGCARRRRHRESLLNGRSSASHLFYSTWSAGGSHPGALSKRLVLTSWNILHHVTSKVSGALSHVFWQGGPLSQRLNC